MAEPVRPRRRPRRARGGAARLACALLLAAPVGARAADETPCPRFASASEGLPTELEWRTHPAVADVNGDGHPDIGAIPRKGKRPGVFLGDGKGRWKESSLGLLIPGFSCGVGVDFADVDGDGHLDLGVADHCKGPFVFLGNGGERWELLPGTTDRAGRLGIDDLRFGDLDGDGHTDLVGIGGMRGGFRLLLGQGGGRLRREQMGLPKRGFGPDLKLADIDADGRTDIVAAFTNERVDPRDLHRLQQVVWLNTEAGFRDASKGLPAQGNFRSVDVGDVDGDGHLDLALSAGSWVTRAPLLVYLGNGGESWTPPTAGHPTKPGDPVTEGVELADLDGDGHLDLVAVTHMDAGLRTWLGDGSGAFRECTQGSGLPAGRSELRGWGIAVEDVTGDGRADIVFGTGRNGAGAVEVWAQR